MLALSLAIDALAGQSTDVVVTLIDVTSLTLSLAVATKIGMRRSARFRNRASLVIYLTTYWFRDWVLVLFVASFAGVPILTLVANACGLGSVGGFFLYVLASLILPVWKLVQNVRRLHPGHRPDDPWRFDPAPRWLWK
jgi:hypothetical protein